MGGGGDGGGGTGGGGLGGGGGSGGGDLNSLGGGDGGGCTIRLPQSAQSEPKSQYFPILGRPIVLRPPSSQKPSLASSQSSLDNPHRITGGFCGGGGGGGEGGGDGGGGGGGGDCGVPAGAAGGNHGGGGDGGGGDGDGGGGDGGGEPGGGGASGGGGGDGEVSSVQRLSKRSSRAATSVPRNRCVVGSSTILPSVSNDGPSLLTLSPNPIAKSSMPSSRACFAIWIAVLWQPVATPSMTQPSV